MVLSYQTRDLADDDLEAVLVIERESHPNAWTRAQLLRWLELPHSIARVATHGGETSLLGFSLSVVEHHRLYLANLAVRVSARRRGVGEFLMHDLEWVAREQEARRIELDVRETNLPAQLLYRENGYRATKIRPALYGSEDGYRMLRVLRSNDHVRSFDGSSPPGGKA